MRDAQRTPWPTLLAIAVVGAAAGLLWQMIRSARGLAAFVPPLTLAVTLAVLGAAVLVLGIALRRRVTRESGPRINPFAAVRVLAAARASQFVGVVFGGFAGGLLLALAMRSVPPPAALWAPTAAALAGGLVLAICGAVAEHLCRVPPGDDDADGPGESGPEGLPVGPEQPPAPAGA